MAEAILRAFVCGHPVAHSRSPLIHGHWLKEHAINGSYERIDVTPENFAGFLGGLEKAGFAGGNITIPHKEAAFAIADRIDDAARLIGAINTVWLEDGALCATNTDWSGFSANLDASAPDWDKARHAVILGAGGAARGILYALAMRGVPRITIVNRTFARAENLAREFDAPFRSAIQVAGWPDLANALQGIDLLVNTTSLWMESPHSPVPDLASLASGAIVTDIVYVPLQTPLMTAAAKRGLRTIDGLGMLLHQAVPGFEKWFGVRPQVTSELRDLIVRDMERHR